MTAKATSRTRAPRLIDVTVVLLERALPSSSRGADRDLRHRRRALADDPRPAAEPRFRVRTVSLDGRPTRHAVPLRLRPDGAFRDVRHTDLIVVPTAEFDMDASQRANAVLIPWLRRWHARGASIAGICTGVSLLAEAGLLDGRPATTHWAMVDEFRRRYPRVDWQPERFVTESGRVFCGGGVYSAIDLSLYLVEKYCGHEVAVETAKALLLETPRIWQSGYGTAPPRSAHDDEGIQKAQDWLFRNFKQEVSLAQLAARVGMSPRNFARRFTVGDGRDAARVPAPAAHRRRPPPAGDAAAQHRRRQPRRRVRRRQLLPHAVQAPHGRAAARLPRPLRPRARAARARLTSQRRARVGARVRGVVARVLGIGRAGASKSAPASVP